MKGTARMRSHVGCVILIVCVFLTNVHCGTEAEAQKWLEEWEDKFSRACFMFTLASWNAGVNINSANKQAQEVESKRFTDFNANMQKELLKKFKNWKDFKNKRLRRAFKYLSVDGPASMPIERLNLKNQINLEMEQAYSLATVCRYKNETDCKMPLNEIDYILKNSKDPKEMEHYFTAWHDKMSELVTPEKYAQFIDLQTEYANANGFRYHTELVLLPYDDESEGWTFRNFQQIMVTLAEQSSNLYEIIHAYVRMKLRKIPEYAGLIEKCGYIPAHITGNMWAQDWSSLDRLTKPFPNAPKLDATDEMKRQGYTPLKMFQEADKFFRDLGLGGMGKEFWENSVLEKPPGRDMTCHATAWDMCLGKGSKDFRIRQCTTVSQRDFVVAHHEMGHIEYFQQYTDLEFPFRNSANPGFHEAIGDALALAVVTPTHLQCKLNLSLGFDDSFCEQKEGPFEVSETDINYLYFIALSKLAFFPFAGAMDFWRIEVWEGKIDKEEYNKMWWMVRKAFQGIVPPTDRGSNPNLFDPAAKWHIPTNCDYLRYLISAIVQFQFYEALCIESGEYDPNDENSKPLYQCDFSGSKEAGKKFGAMMKLGFSKGWPDALEVLTGSRNLSLKSFQHYVQPVLDYMKKELEKNGEIIGFGESCEDVRKRNGKSMWSLMVPEHKKPGSNAPDPGPPEINRENVSKNESGAVPAPPSSDTIVPRRSPRPEISVSASASQNVMKPVSAFKMGHMKLHKN